MNTLRDTSALQPTLRSYWSPCGSWCWGLRSRPPSCGSTTQCQCACRGTAWLPTGAGKEPPWWRWCTPACEAESANSLDSTRGSCHTRSRISPPRERREKLLVLDEQSRWMKKLWLAGGYLCEALWDVCNFSYCRINNGTEALGLVFLNYLFLLSLFIFHDYRICHC